MQLDQDQFVEHVSTTYGLDPQTTRRICAEFAAFWNQDLEAWIRHRHLELQQAGHSNTEIFYKLGNEMRERPFAAPALSERQLRRRIYG